MKIKIITNRSLNIHFIRNVRFSDVILGIILPLNRDVTRCCSESRYRVAPVATIHWFSRPAASTMRALFFAPRPVRRHTAVASSRFRLVPNICTHVFILYLRLLYHYVIIYTRIQYVCHYYYFITSYRIRRETRAGPRRVRVRSDPASTRGWGETPSDVVRFVFVFRFRISRADRL